MSKPLAEVLSAEQALIFRITHRDNVPHILANGLHCQSSPTVNPDFVPIGHPDIMDRRKARQVITDPGGTLADYVPFYFTPCTPMLYNIVTGHLGIRRRTKAEIVVIVSSLELLERAALDYIIVDRNATLMAATMAAGRSLVPTLQWEDWRTRNFKRDFDDPTRFERYQAEALVHRVLPTAAISSIITYDKLTQGAVSEAVSQACLDLPAYVQPSWYT